MNQIDQEEKEACLFAMELLMPEHEFHIQWHNSYAKFKDIQKTVNAILNMFQIEEQWVIVRAANLGLLKY